MLYDNQQGLTLSFFNNNLFDPNNEDFHVLGQYYPHLEERIEEWCPSLSTIKQCPISFFLPHGTSWGIFPNWRSNLYPLQWKGGVLTTGLPGKSNNALFSDESDKTSFEVFSVSHYLVPLSLFPHCCVGILYALQSSEIRLLVIIHSSLHSSNIYVLGSKDISINKTDTLCAVMDLAF